MKRRISTLGAAFALAALPALAQVNLGRWLSAAHAGPATQVGPASAAEINASNGLGPGADLHLEFPIFNRALPNRAQIHATLVYDSLFWQAGGGNWYPQAGAGWWLRTSAAQLIETEYDGTCGWETIGGPGDDGSGSYSTFSFSFQEPDGTAVGNVGSYTVLYQDAQPPPPPGYYPTSDCPSSTPLPLSWPIYDGKGFSVTVDDVGNASAWDGFGDNVSDGLTDLNRNSMTASGASLTDALGAAVTISGSNPVAYTYTGPNNILEAITVGYTSVYAIANFGCYNSWSGNLSVPAYIEYPDGSTYRFGYDPSGRLSSVTYPGGGQVTYSHSMVVQCSPSTVIESFTQTDSLDGSNSWSWQYNDSSGGNETTQTDPYGDRVVVDFDSSGNVTEQDSYDYLKGELESVLVSGSVYDRTWKTYLAGVTNLVAAHTQVLDDFDFTTSTSDTDWGSGSPGALLRQTLNGYTAVGNGEALTSAVTEDGAGNELAKATWTVDSSGNPKNETDYVTNNSATALTTSFSVNSNGTVHTITEPNGAVTTFGYACGTGFFPNSVQTVVGTSTAAWDCNGGVETSSHDLNNQPTTAAYDAMWRPSTVTRADNSVVNFSYPASGNTFARSERWISAAGINYDDVVTSLDTLGRPILQQLRQASGGSSFDTVQTCYDAMSRPHFVTVPYSGTLGQTITCPSSATSGGIFTTYDGLSRPVKVIDGGAGETDYAYNQNDVLTTVVGVTGAPTVSRQQEMGGLGRLRSVCELTAGTSTWPAGACGQTASASGYLTTYTRNALGQITAVSQDTQPGNGGAESRSFSFDQLGRLTAETNPEAKNGTAYYTFDSDSTCGSSAGDLVKRVDAAGNITCYTHDPAHRVTQINYPTIASGFAATPAKTFVYDSTSGSAVATAPGFPGAPNVVGRLVEAYTGPATGPGTVTGFAYDVLGRTVYAAQESTHSAGWYASSESYFADGAVDILAAQGMPTMTYGQDGEGRPTTVSAGTGQNPVTAASYSALGLTSLTLGSGDGDAYTYDSNTGRMTQFQFSVNGANDTGSPTWNANGSLATLAVSDSIAGTGDSQTCTYSHDDIGRLASMGGSSCLWSQSFSFDAFGNLAKTAGTGTSFSASFNLYNQIASVGGVAGVYDSNGNLLNDPVQNTTQANTFDAENKPVALEGVTVVFDALGRAVEGGGQEFVYAPGGGKIAVMSGQTLVRADIPLPGGAEAVYTSSGLAYYRHADWLGSARLTSYPNRTVAAATAYAPYGEEETSGGSRYRSFTGSKQDIDSSHSGGQYDFLMREYSATQSRWWSPDPAGLAAVDPNNPRTWNRYAYVGGNPLLFADPLGLRPCGVAKLDTNSSDKQVGGPYQDDSDAAAAEANDGDCGVTSPQQCMLDGVSMDCALAYELGTGGDGLGAPGWAGSDAIDKAVFCTWSDCLGGGNVFDSNNNVRIFLLGGVQITGPGSADFWVERVLSPAAEPCGWDRACNVSPLFPLGPWTADPGISATQPSGPVSKSAGPQHFWQRPGCGAALAELGGGVIGTALTVGAVVAAIEIGPEVFEGLEGAANLVHLGPVGVPGVLLLLHGGYETVGNCF